MSLIYKIHESECMWSTKSLIVSGNAWNISKGEAPKRYEVNLNVNLDVSIIAGAPIDDDNKNFDTLYAIPEAQKLWSKLMRMLPSETDPDRLYVLPSETDPFRLCQTEQFDTIL